MDLRIVEQSELVLHEPVEIPAAEPGPIQMNLVKHPEVEIPRDAGAVLLILAVRRQTRERAALDGIRTPIGPAQTPKRGAVREEAVAALLELPRPPDSRADRVPGHGEAR